MSIKKMIPKAIFIAIYQPDFRSTARILAKCIDVFVLIFINYALNAFFGLENWFFWAFLAPFIDLFYFHRSPGKCLFEFSNQSFTRKDNEQDFLFKEPPRTSKIYKRNFLFVLWGGALFWNIASNPIVIGAFIMLTFIEIYLVSWHPLTQRMGDIWAGTFVKDLYKHNDRQVNTF